MVRTKTDQIVRPGDLKDPGMTDRTKTDEMAGPINLVSQTPLGDKQETSMDDAHTTSTDDQCRRQQTLTQTGRVRASSAGGGCESCREKTKEDGQRLVFLTEDQVRQRVELEIGRRHVAATGKRGPTTTRVAYVQLSSLCSGEGTGGPPSGMVQWQGMLDETREGEEVSGA